MTEPMQSADAPDRQPPERPYAERGPPAPEAACAPRRILPRAGAWLRHTLFEQEPTFAIACVALCALSALLFTRNPFTTNFIFDEQEALLANPYVRSVADPASPLHWLGAFGRDFWGLSPDRTIGSYRPIPNLLWRALWALGAREQSPFVHHWVTVQLHGINGALVALLAWKLTRTRAIGWLAGALFVATAVCTEAVAGVVGLADVLGGMGALLALHALALPLGAMVPALFAATLFGLFSKESALCCVPLVPLGALMTSQLMHPERPRRWLRAAAAAVATASAFVLYVELRRRLFPVHTPPELEAAANAGKGLGARTFAALLRWYAQPALPRDPLNNPLVDAPVPLRIAGALRVYARGLGQVLLPLRLSGDYSAPQEPAPTRVVGVESLVGGLAMVGPPLAAAVLGALGWLRARPYEAGGVRAPRDARPVVGWALAWVPLSFFPVSNIPVLLPTIRAERFWYFPSIATALLLAIGLSALFAAARRRGGAPVAVVLIASFFAVQCFAARRHACDYADDLVFWRATRKSVPRSAKAHLNYSVMLGARGDLHGRLEANRSALALAPHWPMASIYYADALCRLHRTGEAWTSYAEGFERGPGEQGLIALALQCMWDEKMLESGTAYRDKLGALASKHPGSWLEYLVRDVLANGEAHGGVDPKYRPRSYNAGPKRE